MTLQHRFTLLPPEASILGPHAAVSTTEGHLTIFNASGPIYRCREDDERGVRLAAALLTDQDLGLAKPVQVAQALGRDRTRIFEYRKRYQEDGIEGLEPQRTGPRGPHKLKDGKLVEAQRLIDQGLSNRRVAQQVGVSEGAIRAALRDGRLVRADRQREPQPSVPQASTPAQRNEADLGCPAGVAVRRTGDRALAQAGLLVEAEPVFEPVRGASIKDGPVIKLFDGLLARSCSDVQRAVLGGRGCTRDRAVVAESPGSRGGSSGGS